MYFHEFRHGDCVRLYPWAYVGRKGVRIWVSSLLIAKRVTIYHPRPGISVDCVVFVIGVCLASKYGRELGC